jgi:hypothetical protein
MEIKTIRDKILLVDNIKSCAVMIVSKDGDITEYIITDPTKTITSLADLVEVAGLMSLRYGIVDFDKILGGLKMTTDEFRDQFIVSTRLNGSLLVVVVPNDGNANIVQVIQDVKNILAVELKIS